MTTIRESGFVLKIATGQAIGVTDESVLDPANMSSGSATLGQVPSADGAGGITWSDEIGPVPSGRQILNGTGIAGGGDLSADRTLSVVQSALDPANMSSGSATSGQLPTASGGGAIAWQDPPASINLPVSSTDNALTRWDGTGGDTVQDSSVTLSDTGAMVFPSGGSVSKPGSGGGSEAFGAGATAAGAGGAVVGAASSASSLYGTVLGATSSVTANNGIAIGGVCTVAGANGVGVGQNTSIGTGANNVAVGYNVDITGTLFGVTAIGALSVPQATDAVLVGNASKVYATSSGDSTGAIAIGKDSVIGNATPGAGCDAAICIGQNATINTGCSNSIAVGQGTSIAANVADAVVIGRGANIFDAAGDNSVIAGAAASGNAIWQVALGADANARQSSATALGRNTIADGDSCTAVGTTARIDGHADAIAMGPGARINAASSGNSAGCVVIGHNSTVTPGAGVDASVAIGESASIIAGAVTSIAIGSSAVARSPENIALGHGADCQGAYSMALGPDSACDGSADQECIAIGRFATVHDPSGSNNLGAIVIGGQARIGNSTPGTGSPGAIAIGKSSYVEVGSTKAIAFGDGASVGATGTGAISFGFGASVGDAASYGVAIGRSASVAASATDCVAVGRSASAQANSGVALGFGATVGATHTGAMALGSAASTSAANRVTFASALEVEIGQGLGIWGATPPASQPAKVSDPSGGTTVDTESRTAINAIIDILEGAGLAASV